MGNIVLLDDLTINKMAAGEVIERPANVVKELVENSLDAGANKIIIEIKKGGKTLIKVTDNGKGISRDDIPNSLERHATSKIRKVEDLENTYTMGFRGEALASISSISRLTMITKTKDDEVGIKIVAEAGEIIEAEDATANIGTSIAVENLFFNTPVRYKFLKQDSTEFRYIKEFIQKVALANLNVSFRLINDGKVAFFSNGNGNIRDIVYVLYGKDASDKLIDVDYTEDNIKITGVIGNTYMACENRKSQIIFLNKRNIKNAILMNSADQAFVASKGIGKFGFYILNIEMPANMYDVNVHPTKSEVRFKDEDLIYKVLYRAIKTSYLNKDFLGNNEQEEAKEEYVNNELEFLTNHFETKPENKIKMNNEIASVPGLNLINKNKQELEKLNEKEESLKEETGSYEKNVNQDLILRETKRKVDYKFIGISFKTYIIVEVDGDLYLIDQHAGHERLLYEQIRNNYKSNLQNNTQMTLIPEIIDLTHREVDFVKNNLELFKKFGFDLEFFGDNSVKINGVPDIEYREKINNRDMFMDILDEMINNSRSPIKDIEERFVATVACKAAVKAGMDLTAIEVDNLIQNLLVLKNPYTCPHGRPTTIKLSQDEISIHN